MLKILFYHLQGLQIKLPCLKISIIYYLIVNHDVTHKPTTDIHPFMKIIKITTQNTHLHRHGNYTLFQTDQMISIKKLLTDVRQDWLMRFFLMMMIGVLRPLLCTL